MSQTIDVQYTKRTYSNKQYQRATQRHPNNLEHSSPSTPSEVPVRTCRSARTPLALDLAPKLTMRRSHGAPGEVSHRTVAKHPPPARSLFTYGVPLHDAQETNDARPQPPRWQETAPKQTRSPPTTNGRSSPRSTRLINNDNCRVSPH